MTSASHLSSRFTMSLQAVISRFFIALCARGAQPQRAKWRESRRCRPRGRGARALMPSWLVLKCLHRSASVCDLAKSLVSACGAPASAPCAAGRGWRARAPSNPWPFFWPTGFSLAASPSRRLWRACARVDRQRRAEQNRGVGECAEPSRLNRGWNSALEFSARGLGGHTFVRSPPRRAYTLAWAARRRAAARVQLGAGRARIRAVRAPRGCAAGGGRRAVPLTRLPRAPRGLRAGKDAPALRDGPADAGRV